jgi:hypothetical protein
MIRGILKPMPEYQHHIRAGIMIQKDGREFRVDEDAAKAAQKDFVDEPGKPLVLSAKGYEYMKAAVGQSIVIEPLEGVSDGAKAFEELHSLRDRIAELEQQLEAKQRDEEVLQARIAELEQQVATSPKARGK